MQRFLLTPVKDHGKLYWMANYPAGGPEGRRGVTGRAQRKFSDLERAEEFLVAQKRKYEEKWRWEYWWDERLRKDIARAVGLISGIAGGSLEAAARVYLECVSAKEGRARRGYQEPEKVILEVGGRLGLGIKNLAQRRGMSIEDLVSAILWRHVENVSRERVEGRL